MLRKTQPPQCVWEFVRKLKVESRKWKTNAKCKVQRQRIKQISDVRCQISDVRYQMSDVRCLFFTLFRLSFHLSTFYFPLFFLLTAFFQSPHSLKFLLCSFRPSQVLQVFFPTRQISAPAYIRPA